MPDPLPGPAAQWPSFVRRRLLTLVLGFLLASAQAPTDRTSSSALSGSSMVRPPPSPNSEPVRETQVVTLPPAGAGRLTLPLSSSEFVHLSVAQEACDLLIRLRDRASRTVQEVDTPENWEHPEEIRYVAAVSGDHDLEIVHLGAGQRPAMVTIEVLAWRPADARDRRLAEAHAATLRAEKLRRHGQLEEARSAYREVLHAWRRLGERHPQADLALRLGRLHRLLGDLAGAVHWFDEAEAFFEALPYPAHLAAARWERGRARLTLHDLVAAEADISLALDDLAQPSHRAVAWNDLGVIYHGWGDLFASRRAYGQSIELWHEVGNRLEETRTRQNRSRLYLTLGMADAAADDLSISLRTFRALGRPVEEALALIGQGNVELLRDDPAAALSSFEASLVLLELEGETRHQAVTLNQIAVARNALGERVEAQRAYRQALTLLRQVGDRREEARVLGNLAVTYLDEGRTNSALPLLEQAMQLLRREDPILEVGLRLALARAEWAAGHDDAALREARRALEAVENVRSTTASFEARTAFHAEQQGYYDFAVRQLAELGTRRRDATLQEAAFETSERARARSLLDRLQLPAPAPAAADAEVVGLEDWLRRLANTYYDTAGGASPTVAEIRQLRTLLLRLDERRGQNLRADGQAVAPASLPEIRRLLLGRDRLLLHYHLAEPRSYAWVITDSTIRQFELASRATIERSAQRAYRFLEEGSTLKERSARRALEELAELVLEPLAAALDREVVLVSSHGALQYIPLGALPVQSRGEGTEAPQERRPLLLAYAVGRVPSASVALALASRRPHALLEGALVIADPRFGAEGLPQLEHSREEARRVLGHLDNSHNRLAVGREALASRLRDAETAHVRWLHLATHGQHDAALPALSRLAFAPLVDSPQPVDFLYGFEIEHLDLGAELVVLSACGSALGGPSRSEGLIGLPTAFFVAGAQQVIASLWDVDDDRTVALMDSFYRSLGRGIDPLRALREAQVERWRESHWPMPWATFIYEGPGLVPVSDSLRSPPASSRVVPPPADSRLSP